MRNDLLTTVTSPTFLQTSLKTVVMGESNCEQKRKCERDQSCKGNRQQRSTFPETTESARSKGTREIVIRNVDEFSLRAAFVCQSKMRQAGLLHQTLFGSCQAVQGMPLRDVAGTLKCGTALLYVFWFCVSVSIF